jgi:hypothetical protein
MVKIYVDLIRKGLWSLSNVPTRWHADVEAALMELQNHASV